MKCLFCPEEDMQDYKDTYDYKNPPPLSTSKTIRRTCDICKTFFEFREDKMILYYYGVYYKDNMYAAVILLDKNRIYPGRHAFNLIDQDATLIIGLDYIPDNITPHNLKEKIPTLLTFS